MRITGAYDALVPRIAPPHAVDKVGAGNARFPVISKTGQLPSRIPAQHDARIIYITLQLTAVRACLWRARRVQRRCARDRGAARGIISPSPKRRQGCGVPAGTIGRQLAERPDGGLIRPETHPSLQSAFFWEVVLEEI